MGIADLNPLDSLHALSEHSTMSATMCQLDLFENRVGMNPQALLARINAYSRRPITLRLTDNRVSMAWIDFSGKGPIRVSLDKQYLSAPSGVIDALCRYVVTRHQADWKVVADYARQVPERPCVIVPPRLQSKGRVYDLKLLRDEVNAAHFNGRVRCRIGWGRDGSPRRRKRRSIRFGSWHALTRTIRIHPALDAVMVPREFVRYIVFHEMLHAVVPSRQCGDRLMHHTAEFSALERSYPDFEVMKDLGNKLLMQLPPRRSCRR